MKGYYFVIIEYQTRNAVHDKKYKTYSQAQRRADKLAKKRDVKRAYVGYQCGIDNEVDVKAFV